MELVFWDSCTWFIDLKPLVKEIAPNSDDTVIGPVTNVWRRYGAVSVRFGKRRNQTDNFWTWHVDSVLFGAACAQFCSTWQIEYLSNAICHLRRTWIYVIVPIPIVIESREVYNNHKVLLTRQYPRVSSFSYPKYIVLQSFYQIVLCIYWHYIAHYISILHADDGRSGR